MLTSYTYQIGTAAYTFTAPTYTTSPYTCGETVTYSLTKQDGTAAPSYVTIDPATRVVTISTSTTSLHNTTVNLKVVITRTQGVLTQNLNWTLTLNNPCLATTITTTGVSISTITVGVGLSQATSALPQIADSAATTYSPTTLCGARTYSILDAQNNVSSWVTVSGTTTYTITAAPATNNLYQNSPYALKLRTVLTDYPAITAGDVLFTVIVNQYTCTGSTTYTPSPSAMLTTLTYQIGTGAYTFTAPTFTTTPYTCAETVTYSLT